MTRYSPQSRDAVAWAAWFIVCSLVFGSVLLLYLFSPRPLD